MSLVVATPSFIHVLGYGQKFTNILHLEDVSSSSTLLFL
jgi:hypothetical protein